jgi:hypothetical protein
MVASVMDSFQLELQQSLFKLSIHNNSMAACEPPYLFNPLTKIWCMLDANLELAVQFPEYIKLAQIAMVYVLGFVEDERCFSSLTFLKDKYTGWQRSCHYRSWKIYDFRFSLSSLEFFLPIMFSV